MHLPTSAVPAIIAAVIALALTGCSSSAPASGSASASSASAPASSSASAPTMFALLPESVLAAMPPLTYSTPAGADQAMAANGIKPSISAVFTGGVSRELVYQGKTVGGVELYRFGARVPADSRAKFVPLMVGSFAQKAPTAGKLGTTAVQVADGARGTAITVVGFTQGDDVVLVWGSGVPATQQLASEYILTSS